MGEVAIAVVGVGIAIVGVMVSMMFWMRSEANAIRGEMLALVQSIHQEMKDFHGRLATQDAEFKAHLHYHAAMEERVKGK